MLNAVEEKRLGSATLIDLLRSRAQSRPDDLAYTFLSDAGTEVAELTYAELDRRARALAAGLQRLNAAGERALLLFPPGLDFVVAFLGCLYAGVVAVPAYPPKAKRVQSRLRSIARDSQPRVVLTTAMIHDRSEELLLQVPELAGAAWIPAEQVSPDQADAWQPLSPSPESLAFLQYTSGSTSAPKGVMVTHGNLMHNEEMIRLAFGQSESSVIVGWLPLYHDMGLIGNVLQPLYLGARCVLMSPLTFLQKPLLWLEAISRYGATTSGGPNFAYDLCARKILPGEEEGLDLSRWILAYNGAEPVRPETLKRFSRRFAACGFRHESFYPCYGLAEATLFVTGPQRQTAPDVLAVSAGDIEEHRITPVEDKDPRAPGVRRFVSCGHAWLDQEVAVVDPESGLPCPEGRVGEIWISGPSVAAGYWQQPEATERSFRARLPQREATFLRTGDLGFAQGGQLFITGRLKDLIIVRGRNLYPQDLELTAERSHPALRAGCSAAFSITVDGEERLVLTCEVERRPEADPQAVAAAVRGAVAEEFEVQVQDVVLLRAGTIPKTSSGKIQRHACRAGYLEGGLEVVASSPLVDEVDVEVGAEPVAVDRSVLQWLPEEERRAALASYLRGALAELVRVPASRLDPEQPVTNLGLDSLGAVGLTHRLETDLAVSFPLADLFQGPTLAELADQVLERLRQAPETEASLSPFDAATGPLSYGQRAIWFLQRLAPESAAYNIAVAGRLEAGWDTAALRRTLERVVERHPALRTSFGIEDGEPVQRIRETGGVEVFLEDVDGWSDEAVAARRLELAYRPFDLETDRLVRWAEFRRGGETDFLLVVHHIVSDLWSLVVLLRDLEGLYLKESASLPAPSLTPLAHAVRQRERIEGPEGERLWDFWSRRLAGELPASAMPTDRPRPPVQTFAGSSSRLQLPAELLAGVQEIGRRQGATLYITLLAAFQALLFRYSGQEDQLVGSPTAGRDTADLSGVIGYFVNPVVLRSDLSGDPGFPELLRRVRGTVLEAFEHQDYPFPRLVERLQPERDPSRSPLFQVMFVLQASRLLGAEGLSAFALGEEGGRMELAGLGVRSARLEHRAAQFDLELIAAETGDLRGGLGMSLLFNTDLFDAATADRLLRHLAMLLHGAVADPESRLSRLPLLTAAERSQMLSAWNDTARPFPLDRTFQELFEAQAAHTPETVAAVDSQSQVTYRELNRRANRLARFLLDQGVAPEGPVAVLSERGVDLLTAMIAAFKAGAVYVPLDPKHPRTRTLQTVEQSGSRHVLVADALRTLLPEDATSWKALSLESAVAAPFADHDLGVRAFPESLAYVIYTSGSTGTPKGAMVEQRGMVNHLWAKIADLELTASDRIAQTASQSFDISVWQFLAALLVGGETRVFDDAVAHDPVRLLEEVETAGVTVLETVPSMLRATLEAGSGPALAALRWMIPTGEALAPDLCDLWLARYPAIPLVNAYGPTECSDDITHAFLREPLPPGAAQAPIGRPVPNLRIYVLDRGLEPVPVNVPGEIFAGGIGVGRGYLGDPARTAEVFVPDCFTPGLRLYRTGDLGRWREDGQLEFLGRVDHQVKIRGFRIELGEIEALLAGHPAVREAVVLARPDARGERRLVAYVTVDPETAMIADTADALRELAQESLPEYMVPSAFVVLPEMPLTAVGKIDRRALPEPDWAGETARDLALPRTPMQELIAGIWAEVLGLERVGVDSSFFELGGHSLLATQVVSRIRGALDVEIPLRALFELPGVARLAELVESTRETARPEAPPLRRVPRVDVPLSFAQQRLWFLYQLDPSSPAYNMPGLVRLSGPLDKEALAGSLAEMVRRHESLRTVFPAALGEPRQEILPELAVDLPLTDLSDLIPAEAEARLQALVQEEGRSPFDLQRGPLLRTRLVRLAAEEHALVLNLHHIVSDGWSQGVLVRELSRLYEAFASSQPSPLPELPVQYADYAVWQRDWLQGEALDSLLSWWRGQLAGSLGVLDLPLDHPRPPAFTYRGSRLPVHLPARLAERLHACGRRGSVTPFMILLAAFQALLHRHSGQSDLVVGTAIANRQQTELEDLVGFFMNTLALRADLNGNPRFADLLEQARRTSLGAYAHQGLPFEKLVDELQPERDLSRSPLVQVMLILQNAPMRGLQLPGLEVRVDEVHNGTAKLDLTVNLEETDAGITGWIEYNADLFDRPTVARLARHFETLLDAALAAPQATIEALPLVGDAERFQLLAEWNDTGLSTEPACVHHLFEAQARRTPDAVAVSAGSRSLTYVDLNARANRLAHRLRALGVGTEVRVGLCVDRTPEMVVGLLGILKAGGSYVPLDPAYPAERLAWMLADSAAPVVAVEPATAEALPPHGARVVVIDPDPGFADESADDPAPLAHPDSIAYVIYTSGSTGRPKGVQVPHGALTNFLESMRRRPGLGPDDVLLSVTTLSFDIAGLELFLPLIAGARVALVERAAVSDATRLRAELESTGATVMQATPITWHLLLESGWPGSPNLKVLCGGEAFPRDLARALVERTGSVWNLYGPTETTIWSAVSQVLVTAGASGPVPIGRPIANTTIHLLDRGGSPVPVGVPGELLIGGDGVARGYLNRPDLTAERFVPAGWGEDGGRLYRTGDLARRLPDGSLEFLGRIDHQIKVRGYRIELQEIEAVLAQHPEVREAVVTVRDGSSGVRTAAGFQDRRLVAYVIPASPDAANPAGLRTFLRERLPEYMVPAAFVRLERMPLTPNGKVDRKALPEPEGETLGRTIAPPRSAVEEMVAGVWSQILGSAEFGIHDNFFDLGGHSLLAAQVMSRLQAALRVELPLRLLFERPTVATLSETVEALRREGRSVDLPPVERVPRDPSLPLSFAQERLWVMCQLVPDHSVYNVFQALRFQGDLDLALLERCFAEVIRRHESLRTSFATEKGSPVQRIAGSVDFHLPVVDVTGEAEARELAVQEVRTPFDLASAPLLRVRALRLDDRDHVLLVNMHHLICDNWSIGILNQEVAALYGAAGTTEVLSELPFQYADFAVWQRQWMNEEALRQDLDYWTARLSGELPVLALPTDRPRPAVQSFRGSVRTFELPADLTRAIETASLREGKTLFMTLLAAFATVLHRASGQDDIIIGSPVANRELLETEALIGFFVNILPMRIDLAGEPTYRELLDRVQRTALEAYDHQRLSFERIVEALQLKRDLSRAALRQVGFAFQNAADASVTLPGGIAAVPVEVDAGISRLDMTLFLWKAADGTLRGSWEYSTDLFEASTVDRLLGLFRHTLEDLAADPGRPLLEPAEAAAKAPGSELTESQLLFWFAEKLQTDVQLYFDRATTLFTVAGEIDPKAMETALNALVQASDALRSQIHEFAGVPRRIVLDSLPVALDFVDLSDETDPHAADAAFAAWLEARCERRIDLGERLFDCALVRLGADRTVWFWNVHHVIADAWSITLTAQHLSRLYLQALQGPIGDVEPLPPYQEYVDFERAARKTERYQRSKQYWAEKLARPLNPNPFYRRDAGATTTKVQRLSVDLGPERSDRIRGLARQQGFFSGAVIFASTLMGWLHRLSGETTLRVGTPFANRPERFRQTMGLMMNAAPLQVHVADGETLLSLARKVQVETVETSRHQGYPVRNPAEARAYDVYFNFQIMSYRELCGLPARFELLNSGHSNDHLDLQASDFSASGSFRLDLDFNVAAFDEAQRQRSAGHYLSLLDALIGNPEQPLGDAPMLSAAETDQLLRDFNDTVHPYSEEPCLHRLIAKQAGRTPDAVAVSFEGEALTYAQLDRRANQLAHHLIGLGAQPDRFVGLCVERSIEMVVGLLGIQKAGCAYVPLDPTYPQERLEYMARNADCPVLLTQERLLAQLPPSEARVVCLDRDWPEIATGPETDPGVPSHPESLAYMIYTSGSTGRPKGAMLAHAGVVNRIVWMQEAYGLTPADRVLQKTPFSFDVSVWEFFWPLLTGARLVMAVPGGHQDPRYLVDTIARERITTLHFVPSMLQVFLEQPDLGTACASVKRVFCSGEALPDSARQRFFERLPGAQLHNLYGPTEASVDVTFWECGPTSPYTTVPIGRPIANTRIYILDRYGNLAPPEIPGELHIGGVCLARGYHARPDLTAERFVPDPFGEPGARLYRTGDLVRNLPDGNIEFLGRLDFQVKIRGFRIELAEIEAVLMQHPGLAQAIVMAREDRPGDRRLVAYLTVAPDGPDGPDGPGAPSFDELRALIRGQLPDYMVPAAFVQLETMPLTPSGKVDRRALPVPGGLPEEESRYVAPRTPLEAFLAGVFADVLGVERVSVHGDFFNLGGNSLMATQVATLVQEVLPLEIPLRKLFEARTVAAIAQAILDSEAEMSPEEREVMAQMLSEMEQLFAGEGDEATA